MLRGWCHLTVAAVSSTSHECRVRRRIICAGGTLLADFRHRAFGGKLVKFRGLRGEHHRIVGSNGPHLPATLGENPHGS